VTVPDRNQQLYSRPGVIANAKMLRTSGPDKGPENSLIVDHGTPGWARGNLVRIPFENVMQVESTGEGQELPSITFDTGSEESADVGSDSEDIVAWKKSDPKWEDNTSNMLMPYYHGVEFGNRLPSTKCRAIATMPQQTRCYPFNNDRNCGGQMPEDLPSLVPVDPMEKISNPKRVF
jgi:hypothetical protein